MERGGKEREEVERRGMKLKEEVWRGKDWTKEEKTGNGWRGGFTSDDEPDCFADDWFDVDGASVRTIVL